MFFILDFTHLGVCFTFKIKSKKKLKRSPYPTSNIPKNLKILLIMTFNYHYIDESLSLYRQLIKQSYFYYFIFIYRFINKLGYGFKNNKFLVDYK